MSFDPPKHPEYAATVVRVKHIIPLEGCDNVVGINVFGYQAIVGKDTQVGDLLVVFPAESQLSDEFTRANNLYRHSEKNADPNAKGYLEDNRRVRAMKFRGHRSDALALSVLSLYPFSPDQGFDEGDTFDTLNGVEICRKYVVKTKGTGMAGKTPQEKAFERVDSKFLPEHYDTENYFRNADRIAPEEYIYVTQKVHGTSIRIGNTIVKRKLTWRDRLAQRLGIKVATTEFDCVFGSRKVIKDANGPNQAHYYTTDLWSTEGAKYADLIPQNVVVYGELIGWVDERTPIQPNYTYDVPNGETALYVYRVAVVTADGHLFDLSWPAVREFCLARGLKHVPDVWEGYHADFEPERYLDVSLRAVVDSDDIVPLSPESPVDEGVCIRAEGLAPRLFKAKSPVFLGHETRLNDAEVVDIESAESVDTDQPT